MKTLELQSTELETYRIECGDKFQLTCQNGNHLTATATSAEKPNQKDWWGMFNCVPDDYPEREFLVSRDWDSNEFNILFEVPLNQQSRWMKK